MAPWAWALSVLWALDVDAPAVPARMVAAQWALDGASMVGRVA